MKKEDINVCLWNLWLVSETFFEMFSRLFKEAVSYLVNLHPAPTRDLCTVIGFVFETTSSLTSEYVSILCVLSIYLGTHTCRLPSTHDWCSVEGFGGGGHRLLSRCYPSIRFVILRKIRSLCKVRVADTRNEVWDWLICQRLKLRCSILRKDVTLKQCCETQLQKFNFQSTRQ
jgi:hypothetical protein